ncbi:C-type lectin domain family 2 member B-like [Sceloporus undulatus]|uniref:C-type lectin domain family 2 member B-like n=1 Tax=Sceloporus undulatus TaxID=8520 RepID=UPI001C4C15AB|nr:C-type lectin domain family 2 member B-like [Sceloporus undulatus]
MWHIEMETQNGPNTPNRVTYSNGNCENGPNISERVRLTVESSGMTEQLTRGQNARWSNKCVFVTVIFSVLTSSVLVAFISVMLTKSSSSRCLTIAVSSCPSKWLGYEGKCYYFSEAEGTWDFSQRNCSANGASLVAIENQEEMKFIMKHKEPTDYWIGLRREEGQPWKWANGSIFSGWFEIGANGFCAFLDDDQATSTLCSTQRNWICSKSNYTT